MKMRQCRESVSLGVRRSRDDSPGSIVYPVRQVVRKMLSEGTTQTAVHESLSIHVRYEYDRTFSR